MTTSPSNRAYLTTMKDGSIVAIDDDGVVSVFAIEMGDDGKQSTVVERRNGQRKPLIENDAVLAEAMFAALRSSLLDNRHPSSPKNGAASPALHRSLAPILLLIGIAGGMIGLSAVLENMRPSAPAPIELSRPPLELSDSNDAGLRPNVQAPAAPTTQPTVQDEAAIVPDTRTVEEINAEKGPQLPPESTEPPEQPKIDLPSSLVVEPLADDPAPDVQPEASAVETEAPAPDAPTETAPEATVEGEPTAPAPVPPVAEVEPAPPAPAVEAPASSIQPPPFPAPPGAPGSAEAPAPNASAPAVDGPFGNRVEETAAALEDELAQASAAVAESGPEAVAGQLDTMRKAVEMLQSGQKLPADFVAQLPPDVAATLRDRGVVLTPEEAAAVSNASGENETPISIVRIPAPVLDARRNADGIADIPEANSWSNFGAGVNLPLPGGGEVRNAADLERFGMFL